MTTLPARPDACTTPRTLQKQVGAGPKLCGMPAQGPACWGAKCRVLGSGTSHPSLVPRGTPPPPCSPRSPCTRSIATQGGSDGEGPSGSSERELGGGGGGQQGQGQGLAEMEHDVELAGLSAREREAALRRAKNREAARRCVGLRGGGGGATDRAAPCRGCQEAARHAWNGAQAQPHLLTRALPSWHPPCAASGLCERKGEGTQGHPLPHPPADAITVTGSSSCDPPTPPLPRSRERKMERISGLQAEVARLRANNFVSWRRGWGGLLTWRRGRGGGGGGVCSKQALSPPSSAASRPPPTLCIPGPCPPCHAPFCPQTPASLPLPTLLQVLAKCVEEVATKALRARAEQRQLRVRHSRAVCLSTNLRLATPENALAWYSRDPNSGKQRCCTGHARRPYLCAHTPRHPQAQLAQAQPRQPAGLPAGEPLLAGARHQPSFAALPPPAAGACTPPAAQRAAALERQLLALEEAGPLSPTQLLLPRWPAQAGGSGGGSGGTASVPPRPTSAELRRELLAAVAGEGGLLAPAADHHLHPSPVAPARQPWHEPPSIAAAAAAAVVLPQPVLQLQREGSGGLNRTCSAPSALLAGAAAAPADGSGLPEGAGWLGSGIAV